MKTDTNSNGFLSSLVRAAVLARKRLHEGAAVLVALGTVASSALGAAGPVVQGGGDTTPPTIIDCAPDLKANANTSCLATVPDLTFTVNATDDSGTVVVTQSPAGGTQLTAGVHPITMTATDPSGNTATCVATYTIHDNRVPTISACASAQTGSVGASGTIALPDFATGTAAADNCAVTSRTQSPAAGTQVGLGATTVTVTVADAAGNTASCTTSFTGIDTTPPVISSCGPTQSANADAGSCTALVPDFTSGVVAADNTTATGSLVVTQAPAAGAVLAKGSHDITLTVADAAGNTSTCTASFVVDDVTPPAFTACAPPQTLSGDASCGALMPDFASTASAADTCAGAVVVTQSPAAGGAIGFGTTSVTLTATDAAGTTTTCATSVTVVDTTSPTISAPSTHSLVLGTPCVGQLADITSRATTGDNCPSTGAVVVTQSPAAGTSVVPGSLVVTLTATDASGNTSTAT
ncbi:MAG: HYR domain-containing protein, partial [Planctomycetia bacterium]